MLSYVIVSICHRIDNIASYHMLSYDSYRYVIFVMVSICHRIDNIVSYLDILKHNRIDNVSICYCVLSY
jgi:phage-related holin